MTQPHRRRHGGTSWRLALALAGVLALPAAAGPDGVTYRRDIAPLLAANCQACHRDGEIAPFPLTSYEEVYRQRHKVLRNVERRKMPPWPPVPGHGDFVGERRLADADIARLRAWVQAGAPEGDPRDPLLTPAFPALWSAGAPDVVLEPDTAFDVPSADRDLYRCFVVPTAFAEDRFVSVAEFLPGDRRIVHHVLGYIYMGRPRRSTARSPDPATPASAGPASARAAGSAGWAPGAPPTAMPEGVGMLLPAGATVVLQVHYHNRTGGPVRDLTRVGLRFARATVDKRVRVIPVLNRGFLIPAGEERHVVRATYTLPPTWHMHAIGISPHMHLLGREMRVTVTYPDGVSRP